MKGLRIALALAAVQGVLIAGYLSIESLRSEPDSPFTWERLDAPVPALSVTHGSVARPLPDHALVHFWATWCAPCLEELPSLLAATEHGDVPLLAVTDEPWPVVERYFDGAVPAAIVRDPTGDAATGWEVSGLPDTFVIHDGRLVGRMGGPRDWASADARRFLATLEAP